MENKTGFTVFSQLSKSISSTKDGGIKFNVHTKELTDDEKLAIMKYAGTGGWLLFKEIQILDEDIPDYKVVDDKKPIHVRIRGLCYYYAKARLKREPTDEEVSKLYHAEMDELFDKIGMKLDSLVQ